MALPLTVPAGTPQYGQVPAMAAPSVGGGVFTDINQGLGGFFEGLQAARDSQLEKAFKETQMDVSRGNLKVSQDDQALKNNLYLQKEKELDEASKFYRMRYPELKNNVSNSDVVRIGSQRYGQEPLNESRQASLQENTSYHDAIIGQREQDREARARIAMENRQAAQLRFDIGQERIDARQQRMLSRGTVDQNTSAMAADMMDKSLGRVRSVVTATPGIGQELAGIASILETSAAVPWGFGHITETVMRRMGTTKLSTSAQKALVDLDNYINYKSFGEGGKQLTPVELARIIRIISPNPGEDPSITEQRFRTAYEQIDGMKRKAGPDVWLRYKSGYGENDPSMEEEQDDYADFADPDMN